VAGSTKAQIQMGEIVIVMMIFFFIVGFGIVFFTQFIQGETSKAVDEKSQLELASTAKLVAGLPEIHCSIKNDENFACIDLYKAIALNQRLQGSYEDRYHYSELFAGYKVDLECIYPKPCTASGINDYTLFDFIASDKNNTVPFVIPVSIYQPSTRRYGYGLLTITQIT
jgi:hypothetical protein